MRADRVVWTVVAAGLVDRQELHEFEADARRPIDELAQPFEVTDAEIRFRADGEERRENAGDALFGSQIPSHSERHATP